MLKEKEISTLKAECESKLMLKEISTLKAECESKLMLKENEISTLKEDNRLLAKQFRQRKEGHQKRQQFLQKVSS